MLSILCLGDSITFGTGSTPGHTYPEILAGMLRPSLGAIRTLNAGKPGASTRDYWNYLCAAAAGVEDSGTNPSAQLRLPAYDAAVILLGTNDCRRDNWVETPESLEFLGRISGWCRARVAAPGRVLLCSVPPLATPMRADILGGQHPWVQSRIEHEMNPAIAGLAGRIGAVFVDIHGAFRRGLASGQVLYDGVHPFDAGYVLIARTLADALLPVLRHVPPPA